MTLQGAFYVFITGITFGVFLGNIGVLIRTVWRSAYKFFK